MSSKSRIRAGLAAGICLLLAVAGLAVAQADDEQSVASSFVAAAENGPVDTEAPSTSTKESTTTTAPTTTTTAPSTTTTAAPVQTSPPQTSAPQTAPPQTAPPQTTPPPTAPPQTTPPQPGLVTGTVDTGCEATILSLVNAERSAAGLPTLSVVSSVTGITRAWSSQMAANGALSHSPSYKSQIDSIMNWTAIAENVGTGTATPDAAAYLFGRFMNSAPHRANILGPVYRYTAVGCIRSGGEIWVTQDFWAT